MSFDRLLERIVETQNPTVAGLDPKLEYIPAYLREEQFRLHGRNLKGASQAILAYNKALIDALCDVVPAVKPQCAYYEMFGYEGMKTLHDTIQYAKSKGMYVITDGKRNDIGTTMEAYAVAHLGATLVDSEEFEAFGGDSLTVNGYLGTDGVAPLVKLCNERDKGIFVLCKTSNKSSGELQDRQIGDMPVYRVMGEMCEHWGADAMGRYGYSAVGAVVGATYPEQLEELRRAMPHTFFLVPGYGAQGGGAWDVLGAFDERGLGAIVNSSRGILCAWQKEGCAEQEFAAAARREALRMKEDITQHLPAITLP
ncbi:orotidine-5'-phosphate decarboxylase [Clostridiaceae bacterium NSJ-31]|uniref:Orotidine 5'-phosphate decarboxylase n=1 Tax=Ligaoa zhengdingensis TaxID=2763658 RepID=A0A926HZB1_9FIRM|nr:orotidine-5'-phosphate decarboxylase [Ligaoa zhengdingensis]MBC8545747.1 orotidine-5'-phosphate decarboxylase [Ligaoa zhengdingensis]